ncbi:MAG: hypothetical protein JNL94_10285, partial [Planctomycetes bacterium]|nr:hypothetical protein [Planctomycetota bacterium]
AQAAKSAANSAEAAAKEQREGKTASALGQQRDSQDALNRARDAMANAGAEQESQREDLAKKQDYLAGRTKQLEELLERLKTASQQDQQPAVERAKQSSSDASSRQQAAARSLERSDAGQAAEQQQQAIEQLQQMKQELDASAAGAKESMTPQQRKEQYQDLAKRQEELAQKTRDLMDRLREKKQQKGQESLQGANERMQQGRQQLEQEDGEEASERQQEAEKYLNKAEQELQQQQDRYENLRQEELLVKVREELAKLRDEQKTVLDETGAIELERAEKDGNLSRSARSRVRQLATRTKALKQRNDDVNGKLREDGAKVFTFLLERNSEDLTQIDERLSVRPFATDADTQALQEDVVSRYEQLLGVLKEELDRRRQSKTEEEKPEEQQNQQPQQGKKPLIPELAELLMVKRMEEDALRRIDAFLKNHPEIGTEGLDDITRDRLIRMGHQHAKITELFNNLVPDDMTPGEPAPPEETK